MAAEAADWQVSTVPAVKASIVGLMRAEEALAGVTVDYGDPGVSRIQKEHVFLGDATQAAEGWAPFGHLKRAEDYVIDLYVHAARAGQTQQEATERAMQLFGCLNLMLRPYARRSTAVAPGVWSIEIRFTGLREFAVDDGYGAFVTGEIRIQSRI